MSVASQASVEQQKHNAAIEHCKENEWHLSIEICILSSAASLAALSATSSSLYLSTIEAGAAEGRGSGVRLVAKRNDAGVHARRGGNLQLV